MDWNTCEHGEIVIDKGSYNIRRCFCNKLRVLVRVLEDGGYTDCENCEHYKYSISVS